MKILALGDTQLGGGKSLSSDRLADQEAVLGRIADLADSEQVELVVHCGDVFDSRHPDEEARMVFKRWARRISERRPLVVVAGNHDLRGAAIASAVDLYDECAFARRPEVLSIDSLSLAVLPWTPPGLLVARRDGDRAALNADMAELLLQSARELYEQCGEGPKMLALHWAISGAALPTGLSTDLLQEPVLPLRELELLGFDAILAGHIHKPQLLSTGPLVENQNGSHQTGRPCPILYVGSPCVVDWGETACQHGAWILDENGPRFEPIEDRRFVTFDVDLSDSIPEPPLDETDVLAAALAAEIPFDGALVRLRYKATGDRARRIDHGSLRNFCLDAGAAKLIVQPEIIRADRARVEGVDENLGPLEAIDLYIEHNFQAIPSPRADALRALTSEYLEAA